MKGQLDWFKGGILLAISFVVAVWLVKPIGVSTQFVIADGIVWNAISENLINEDPTVKSGYSSENAYLDKSGGKYAKNIANPLNYSFVFVFAIILGSFISSLTGGPRPDTSDRVAPKACRSRFGTGAAGRYIVAFVGGFLVLFGARLAGGCTSGHMMSGMMQTSLSGYLFTVSAFIAALPLAIIFYSRKA